MIYQVKLTPSELDALGALVGCPLDSVVADGWAAELRSGASVLTVTPEEVATPDRNHPHGDVERPLVRIATEPVVSGRLAVLKMNLGVVRAVNVVSTLIRFSPVVTCPPEEVLPGVVLPESRGWGWLYYPPGQRAQAEREAGADAALVDLDIAFELVTEHCPSLVVYTRGYFVKVSFEGLPAEQEWASFGAFARRSLGGGR